MTKSIIEQAWCKDTCFPKQKDIYDKSHPSTGQCAITALLVQDLFGGEIVKNNKLYHYFNFIYNQTDGDIVDFTKNQFSEEQYESLMIDSIVPREELLSNADTKLRYDLLKSRFIKLLQNEQKATI